MQQLFKSFLPHLNQQQLDSLLATLPNQPLITLPKGHKIYYKGQNVDSLFLLKTGLVRIYDVEERQDINIRLLCDESVVMPFYGVAQSWQIRNNCRDTYVATDSAECITDCTGYKLPLTVLDGLGEWSDKIKLELALRHYLSMEERLKMLQLTTVSERYHIFVTTMPAQIIKGMPSFHVASYLGMSPETLSRIRSKYHTS